MQAGQTSYKSKLIRSDNHRLSLGNAVASPRDTAKRVNVGEHQGLSKLKLIVEVTKKQSDHHEKICKEVERKIELGKVTKMEAKQMMRLLLRKYNSIDTRCESQPFPF